MVVSSETTLLTVEIPFELTNGNDGRGSKWFSSARLRKEIEVSLAMWGLRRTPFGFPVGIRLTRILGKNQRFWDEDSFFRGNSKELIDALVAVGWFFDDSRKYVKRVEGIQDDSKRDSGPACIIQVLTFN